MHDRITNRIERSRETRARGRVRMLVGSKSVDTEIPAVGLVVGAGAGTGLRLADETVSARHASLVPVGGGIEVRDLGSRNGTWVGGLAVNKATVPFGSTVRIGQTDLQILPQHAYQVIAPSTRESFASLVGRSTAMRCVYALLERASATEAPVLLFGASGTGKEVAARAIHESGARKDGPFVVFDCGAVSANLFESGLFGHKRGSFTGAAADHPGAFARAHGGTLFLDELGELPLELQPKLLRMLECGEVMPLGAREEERYDVRILAATHRDLWAEVAKGRFREDLYYRLAVIEVSLPPLVDRMEDVPDIVGALLERLGRTGERVEGPALDRLMSYAWPGNVRELRNAVARAVALGAPGIPFRDLPILLRVGTNEVRARVTAEIPFYEARERALSEFEHAYVEDLMRRAEGNVSEASRIAQMDRKQLYRILERTGFRQREPGDT